MGGGIPTWDLTLFDDDEEEEDGGSGGGGEGGEYREKGFRRSLCTLLTSWVLRA